MFYRSSVLYLPLLLNQHPLAGSVQSPKSCLFSLERNSSDLNANLSSEMGKQLDIKNGVLHQKWCGAAKLGFCYKLVILWQHQGM